MEGQKTEGQIVFSAHRLNAGGRVSRLQKKEIRLELIASEDETILAQEGLNALRQRRILRLSTGAAQQGAVLTYDDLVHLLSTSLSTVRRDVRALQQAGFLVPVHRRRGRKAGVVVIAIMLMMFLKTTARAQLSSLFGNVAFEYEYDSQKSEATSTSSQLLRQQYNLGLDGRILDPRLATFSVSSSFSSSFLADENARGTAFGGTLSLLQGKPYGLVLRSSKSFSSNGSDTDATSLGALLRLTFPQWPQLFLDFDRVSIESRGDSRSDNAITTGRARFSHRFRSTMLDGEIGVQNFGDELKNSSQDRYFARLNNTVEWSPTTTLRSVNDAFLEGNQLVMGSSYAIENRPDPTLRRTASIAYRSNKSGDEQDSSLSLSGALSKSFFPQPWLQANTFTSAIAQKGFGSDDGTGFAWSGGGSTAISYFRPVAIASDYALALSYQTEVGRPATTQQFHLGAVSRSLEPLRLSGDYFLGLQTGISRSTRQFIAGKADMAVTPQFFIRSFADFLTEKLRSSDSENLSSADRLTTNVGAGVSYRPLFNLTIDLIGAVQWNNERDTSGTTMRGNLHLGYIIPRPGTPTLDFDGTWENSTAADQNRLQLRSQFSYRVGAAIVGIEHRFERNSIFGSPTLNNSIRLSVSRAFRLGF
ncbi:MAG: DUF1670 domain-containing protein [Deltaproteobacteria bacterium]|nr:DUF1670 domain-containing protein [Deltaproteobacteria bacterium]